MVLTWYFYFDMVNKTVKELKDHVKARTTFIKVIIGQLVEIKIFRLYNIFSNFQSKIFSSKFREKISSPSLHHGTRP